MEESNEQDNREESNEQGNREESNEQGNREERNEQGHREERHEQGHREERIEHGNREERNEQDNVEDSRSMVSVSSERRKIAQSSTMLRGLKSGMVNPMQPFGYGSATQMGRIGAGSVSMVNTGNYVIHVDRTPPRGDISPQVTVSTLAGMTVANFPVSTEFMDRVDILNLCIGLVASALSYIGYAVDIYHIGKAFWEDYQEDDGYDKTASVVAAILGGHIGGSVGAALGTFVGSLIGGYLGSAFGLLGELVGLMLGSFIGSVVGGILGAKYLGEIVENKLYRLYEIHIQPRIPR